MIDIDQLGQALAQRGLTVAVGESATGGLLSYLLSSAPGSSRFFMGGVTAYANEAKAEVLAVPRGGLRVRRRERGRRPAAMARGARDLLHADIGVADTGIAGPGGATPTKPVGLFYIALSSRDGYESVQTHHFDGDREQVRRAAADAALSLLAEYVDAQPIRDGSP